MIDLTNLKIESSSRVGSTKELERLYNERGDIDEDTNELFKKLNTNLEQLQTLIINNAKLLDKNELSFYVSYSCNNYWLNIVSSTMPIYNVNSDVNAMEFYYKNYNTLPNTHKFSWSQCWLFHDLWHHMHYNSSYSAEFKKRTKMKMSYVSWEDMTKIVYADYYIIHNDKVVISNKINLQTLCADSNSL